MGRTGRFDGGNIIDIIFEQPAASRFVIRKLFTFFVHGDPPSEVIESLAATFRAGNFEVKPVLLQLFRSKEFYSERARGTHIKSPVELVVSSYVKLGLNEVPGIPDFNEATTTMGQTLFWPPTVAGWAHGRSWITPGLLLERGNFARDVLFPDIDFLAHDRYSPDAMVRAVHERIKQGYDISSATVPDLGSDAKMMAESNMLADRDEDFNTRYGSYRGWQMAIERVKPIPRQAARVDLTGMVMREGLRNTAQVVDHFLLRFLRVPIGAPEREMLVAFLDSELGTSDIGRAATYLEDPLRMLVHLIMSQPEYQLG